jgi:uncharacterized protein (TIGR02596 family)
MITMSPLTHKDRAFSLIELLVVVAIFALLATLALPAFTSIATGGAISRGGQLVGDQIVLARQEATSKNRRVQVRFVKLPDPGDPTRETLRGVQLWIQRDDGTFEPQDRLLKLPETILISESPSLSPLISQISGTTNFPGVGSRSYVGFAFQANGGIDGAVSNTANFITTHLARDGTNLSSPPSNYYAVRINPFTGRVTYYRP